MILCNRCEYEFYDIDIYTDFNTGRKFCETCYQEFLDEREIDERESKHDWSW